LRRRNVDLLCEKTDSLCGNVDLPRGNAGLPGGKSSRTKIRVDLKEGYASISNR